MRLWHEWSRWCAPLRGACARYRTFLWMGVALAGFWVRRGRLILMTTDLALAPLNVIRLYGYRFIQLGLIAQGIMLALATAEPQLVWVSFGSWLRTIRRGVVPSEAVVAGALRNALPHFLKDNSPGPDLAKFIQQRLDLSKTQAHRLAA